jgi:hypothetical protein
MEMWIHDMVGLREREDASSGPRVRGRFLCEEKIRPRSKERERRRNVLKSSP